MPAVITPTTPLPQAAASALAALLADSLLGDLPALPLARARCETAVAALFPGRLAMVKAGLKDPCAILAREVARRAAGGSLTDPASLVSGAAAEGGGLKTPPPRNGTTTTRLNVTAPAQPAGGNGTAGTLLYVRRNETRAGDVMLEEGGK